MAGFRTFSRSLKQGSCTVPGLHANAAHGRRRSCCASPVPEYLFRTGGLGRDIPEVVPSDRGRPARWASVLGPERTVSAMASSATSRSRRSGRPASSAGGTRRRYRRRPGVVRLATPDNWPMGIGHVRRRSGSRALVARDGGRVRRHDPAKARRGVDASRHAAASRRSWASLETRDAASLPECDVVLLRRLPRVGMDSASLSSRPGVFAATRVARADQPAAARDQRSFGMRCSGDT
jgi:hypothetical protein